MKKITIDSVSRIACLVIGDAGIGKTSLLRTIPEDEKVFVISAESGLLCVRDLIQQGKVEGVEIERMEDLKELHQGFVSGKIDARWIFIDSLTEIASRCVEAMKVKYPAEKDKFKLWGDYDTQMTGLIKAFRDLSNFNVVFTALPRVEKDENNKRFIGVEMSGSSLKNKLTSYFDEVFYMKMIEHPESKEDVRGFVTQPIDQYPAKDRSGALNVVEKPDLSVIYKKIMDYRTNKQEKQEKKGE